MKKAKKYVHSYASAIKTDVFVSFSVSSCLSRYSTCIFNCLRLVNFEYHRHISSFAVSTGIYFTIEYQLINLLKMPWHLQKKNEQGSFIVTHSKSANSYIDS